MTVTLSEIHEELRRSTAKMLDYDYANLTAAESVRLDRAAMLRLELDDCQNKKLASQPFDMNKYIAASEALERLVGGQPEQTTGPHHDAAVLQVEGMIGRLIAAKEYADHERDADAREREEMAAIAAADDDGWRAWREEMSQPAGGYARRDNSAVTHPALIEPSAPASGPLPLTGSLAAKRVESAEEKMARVNSTPALPPRGEQPWKAFEDDGSRTAWFRPHG
jgi:hypothetical protein